MISFCVAPSSGPKKQCPALEIFDPLLPSTVDHLLAAYDCRRRRPPPCGRQPSPDVSREEFSPVASREPFSPSAPIFFPVALFEPFSPSAQLHRRSPLIDALNPWETVGSFGVRNFMLCKKPGEDGKPVAVEMPRKSFGSWKTWFNKSQS
ncbi:hypothetical protein E3N88_42598 [Mikania micrantha]|uniref:Uncharacterized protein n=1 Tax=Mikania micrantha TaxID=192012 RepID=A0A5N6LHD5_9ASTR|nr:hypothetical protein E3N88_42598 [Mikania micrantha]